MRVRLRPIRVSPSMPQVPGFLPRPATCYPPVLLTITRDNADLIVIDLDGTP